MQPGENINQVAAEQIRPFLRQRPAGKPYPIFTFDVGYEAVQLGVALAGEGVGILVRLRSGRCFYADPPPGPMEGVRGGTRPSSAVTTRPTGPRLPTSGVQRMRSMGGCSFSAGAACMRSRSATRSGERAGRGPSSAGH